MAFQNYKLSQIPGCRGSRGQALLEIVLAIALAALIVVIGARVLGVSLRSGQAAKERTNAAGLAQEAEAAVRAVAQEKWYNIWGLTKDTQEYYPAVSGTQWVLSTDTNFKTITMDGKPYDRRVIFANISRDPATGDIEATYNAATDDPSTQKATITVFLSDGTPLVTWDIFLTRSAVVRAPYQTDWSGGAGAEGPVTSFGNTFSTSTNINVSTSSEITLSP